MKKSHYILAGFLMPALALFQGCNLLECPPTKKLTLQPEASHGKDATIWYISVETTNHGATNGKNYGNDPMFGAMESTFSGNPGRKQALIDFDLNQIAQNKEIITAKLSLYKCNNCGDEGHRQLSGTNEGLIQRVTGEWEENSVTWDNQPSVTEVNQVLLPASISVDQDYTDIDVSNLIQDLVNLPENQRHGLLLSIQNPNYYRSLIFASSDHSDPAKHPKLVIQYK